MRQVYITGVATLSLDEAECTGCGICVEVCPHGVFLVSGGQARIVAPDSCMECGACVINCPFGALSVRSGVGCAKAVMKRRAAERGAACCTRTETAKEEVIP